MPLLCKSKEAGLWNKYLVEIVEQLLSELAIFNDGGSIECLLFLSLTFNRNIPFVAALPLLKFLVLDNTAVLLCQRRVC